MAEGGRSRVTPIRVREATLSQRALNRALLARQMLLERSTLPLAEVVEAMGGIQMQYAPAGYIGLWSRMRDFARPMLTEALEQRRVVQGTMMRATIHTVSARDYWPMMAGVRRINREWYTRVAASAIGETDLTKLAAAVRAELARGPLRAAELADRLAAHAFPPPAFNWAQTWVDLLRIPPSGTWERRRADLHGLAEQWLPRPQRDDDEREGIALLIRRYLGAFGPAPYRDIASWMGMNVGQMREVANGLELRRLRGDDGTVLLDLPDAPLPEPDTPAAPRFVAVWDAMLLVHARRTGVLPEEYRSLVFNTKTPHSVNTFLLDGQVAGTWRHEAGRIELSPFRRLTGDERDALESEAKGLAALHA
jgi:hypothetical protein